MHVHSITLFLWERLFVRLKENILNFCSISAVTVPFLSFYYCLLFSYAYMYVLERSSGVCWLYRM